MIFTVDVEEWWSVHSFQKLNLNVKEGSLDDRIEIGVEKILTLLDQFSYKATFFILGRVAEKYPNIVNEISNKGHQVGTHGYNHKLIYEQSKKEFEIDLIKSIKILEKITGEPIISYRAPSYSITKQTLWALEILAKNGIKYDSSIVPVSGLRFGIKNAPKEPYIIDLPDKTQIVEIPPNIAKVFFKNLPLSSGFAFRLFPKRIINKYFKSFIKYGIKPMIIIHNWEMDPRHPRLNPGIKGTLIHYYNINRVGKKIEFFFSKYKYNAFSEFEITKRINFTDLK